MCFEKGCKWDFYPGIDINLCFHQRQRKLEQQKLSKDFQKVISEFQRAQRLSASKQREYVDKAKATTAMLQSQSGQPLYVVHSSNEK
jgi:hypothetical protein